MLKAKQLFDLLEIVGEKLTDNIHILMSDVYDSHILNLFTYRKYVIYHSKGHCIVVDKEIADEDEEEHINGYKYSFSSDLYEGFKEVSIDEVIEFIKALKDHLEGTTGDITNQRIEGIYKALTAPKEKLPYQDFLKRKIKVAENRICNKYTELSARGFLFVNGKWK